MEKQKTLAAQIFIEGKGLHTGNMTRATFKPAPPNFGIKFVRTDLKEPVSIAADHSHVLGIIRGTTIGNDTIQIHTIEHMLAAMSGLGIDNLEVHLTNNEPPVLDGSALGFAQLFQKVGIVEQDAPKEYLTIKEPVTYEHGDTKITAYPSDELKIDVTIQYKHPFLSEQKASITINPDSFVKELSAARTFCFDYEIEALQKKGLAKGGDLTNAIVVGLAGIHNPEKTLRYENEFARHKALDMLGDLYLIGKPVKAHIVAVKCGHGHNINFAKELLKKGTVASAFTENSVNHKGAKIMENKSIPVGTLLDITQIQKIIPHRYPFLLIDRVKIVEESKTAIGYKCVSGNENFFQGHFPGRPIMPGVLIVEAMAQTACVLFLSRVDYASKLAVFMGIDAVKFRKPVTPGDMLELKVDILRLRERGGKIRGEAYVNGVLTTEAEFMCAIIDKED